MVSKTSGEPLHTRWTRHNTPCRRCRPERKALTARTPDPPRERNRSDPAKITPPPGLPGASHVTEEANRLPAADKRQAMDENPSRSKLEKQAEKWQRRLNCSYRSTYPAEEPRPPRPNTIVGTCGILDKTMFDYRPQPGYCPRGGIAFVVNDIRERDHYSCIDSVQIASARPHRETNEERFHSVYIRDSRQGGIGEGVG